MTNFLLHYFSYPGNLSGAPVYVYSGFLTKPEFDTLTDKAWNLVLAQRSEAKKHAAGSPLIRFCTEVKMDPEPEGSGEFSWRANCPSGGQHHILISTKSEMWGCGYCRRKGDLEELKAWINNRSRK